MFGGDFQLAWVWKKNAWRYSWWPSKLRTFLHTLIYNQFVLPSSLYDCNVSWYLCLGKCLPQKMSRLRHCLYMEWLLREMTWSFSIYLGYTVYQNIPPLTWHTRSDYDNFWQNCYRDSKKSDDAFSHLTCLVLQHYLAKEETQKTDALCVQHSPTAAVILSSFLLNHAA